MNIVDTLCSRYQLFLIYIYYIYFYTFILLGSYTPRNIEYSSSSCNKSSTHDEDMEFISEVLIKNNMRESISRSKQFFFTIKKPFSCNYIFFFILFETCLKMCDISYTLNTFTIDRKLNQIYYF